MATAITGTEVRLHKTPGQAKEIIEYPITGAAAIDHTITPGRPFRLVGVRLHLSAAPTTSENFSIGLNDGKAAAYDTVLYKRDFSVGSLTDLVLSASDLSLDSDHMFKATDFLDIDWTNTDTSTYGLTVLIELL